MKTLWLLGFFFSISIFSSDFAFADMPPLLFTQVELNGTKTVIDPNKICPGHQGTDRLSNQWLEVYNTYDTEIHIAHVKLFFSNPSRPVGGIPDLTFNLPPKLSCTLVLPTINYPFIQNTTNVILSLMYQYNGKNYTLITPPLTDNYRDSKTWQYDGNEWIFTDKDMAIPEFPIVIPVLLIGIILLIVFSRMKIRI